MRSSSTWPSLRYRLDRWPPLQANAPKLPVLHSPYYFIIPPVSDVRRVLPDGHVISSRHAGHRPATSWGVHYTTSCNTQSSAPEDGKNNCSKHVELTGIINKPLLLHLVGLYYLYQWCTVKQISDNEIYLLIKYIKNVLWRVVKRLSLYRGSAVPKDYSNSYRTADRNRA